MTLEKMTPQKWAFKLTHILNAYAGLDRFPVDVKAIATDFSNHQYPDEPITKIKGESLQNFDGGLYKAPPGKKGWGILYNNAIDSKGRINFTIAHEFGHYLLHRIDYPDGIECGEQDIVRWDSEYGQIEHQANLFATNLLMPLDDYRKQIDPRTKINLNMISQCADRYEVSLIAATLRWIDFTELRAVIVVSRDDFILWARSSKSAFRSRIYFKTTNRPPIAIPKNSLAAEQKITKSTNERGTVLSDIWFEGETCEEFVVFSERYNFVISVLQFI